MRGGSQDWGEMARLAYPACVMKCIESWTFSGVLLVAGLLPGATVAVAAISVSFNCYGLLYMPFLSFGMAVCTRCAACAACSCDPPGDTLCGCPLRKHVL